MMKWYPKERDFEFLAPEETDLDLERVKALTRERIEGTGTAWKQRSLRLTAAVLAAVLLTACAYGAAAGVFSGWFQALQPEGTDGESVEELFSTIGTAVGQSQMAGGVSVTLNGTLFDGRNLMLSLTLEDGPELLAEGAEKYGIDPGENSWLQAEAPPEPEPENVLYGFDPSHMRLEDMGCRVEEDGRITLLLRCQDDEEAWRTGEPYLLHLENFQVAGLYVLGTWDFTFTFGCGSVLRRYTGGVEVTTDNGVPLTISEVRVNAFSVEAAYTTPETLEGQPLIREEALRITAIRVDGKKIRWKEDEGSWPYASRGYSYLTTDTGTTGFICVMPLKQAVVPHQVEAIQIGGAWLELADLRLEGDGR